MLDKNILKLNAPRPDSTIKVNIWGGVFILKNSAFNLVTKFYLFKFFFIKSEKATFFLISQ